MLKEISVSTNAKFEFVDITSEVEEAVAKSGVKEGICVIYCPHTTAGITINENADPDVARDVTMKLSQLAEDPGYHHSEGNSAGHVVSTVAGASETIIIHDGKLTFGTWQNIYFVEGDGPRSRKVLVKIQ